MRLSRVEKAKLEQSRARAAAAPPVEIGLEGLLARLLGGPVLPTQRDFVLSSERIKWFSGPIGASKTSSLVASTIVPGLLYPGSKWFIGRSTWWTLEQTTLERWLECVNRLGPNAIVDKEKGPPMRVWIASAVVDDRGHPLEPSEYVFHGLDDLEKLGSTQFNGIAIDEANEITENMATTLNGRLRRALPGQARPEGPYFLNFASNPVRRSHWLHKKFCNESDGDAVPWGRKFRPAPRENEGNLPRGYYEEQARGMSPEMRLRFIEGECGPDVAGTPVFPEFRHSLHVGDLKPIAGLPIIRCWDFGRRRPAVTWTQVTPEGWRNRLAADLGDNISTKEWAKRVLERSAMQFSMAGSWRDFCDPHGTQKRSSSDKTDIEILQELGIRPTYRDVGIKMGLELMSSGLCTLVHGRPRSMFDRSNCGLLIEGYGGGYSWPTPRPGHALKETPLADGFYEHPMDCDRYLEVNLGMGSALSADQHKRVLRVVRNPLTGY